jgi:hypothetical protein
MKTTITKFDSDCAEIARLTNENAHTEALIKLAQMLGNDKYAKILGHLRDIHHLEGYLTRAISAFRDDIAMKLFDNAYATYDAVSFSQIKRAF